MGEAFINISGVQRRLLNTYTNINGVWRSSVIYTNINGIYRGIDSLEIAEKDILGFRMIYISDHNAIYKDLPHLKYNPKIPANLSLTGSNQMDTNGKGVIFQYTNKFETDQLYDEFDQEGILMYVGRLYAVLANRLIVDVTNARDIVGWEGMHKIHQAVPGISESFNINRMNHIDIKIYSKLSYVINGINTEGWNRIFSIDNYIGSLGPIKQHDEFNITYNYINALPLQNRNDNFYKFSEIGIARDLHTSERNMVGSHGQFSHSFTKITVNGKSKPFIVEIYN